MSGQKVVDGNGAEVVVGVRVIYGAPMTAAEAAKQTGTVVEVTDWDVDYDDDLGRGRLYPPKVKVRFDDGDEETASTYDDTRITWSCYPDGPDEYLFVADDVEVVVA